MNEGVLLLHSFKKRIAVTTDGLSTDGEKSEFLALIMGLQRLDSLGAFLGVQTELSCPFFRRQQNFYDSYFFFK